MTLGAITHVLNSLHISAPDNGEDGDCIDQQCLIFGAVSGSCEDGMWSVHGNITHLFVILISFNAWKAQLVVCWILELCPANIFCHH